MIQQTSIKAYLDITASLGNRHLEVIMALRQIQPANNRMISEFMKMPINSITPRVNELRKKGLISYVITLVDVKTKKSTMFWRINDR